MVCLKAVAVVLSLALVGAAYGSTFLSRLADHIKANSDPDVPPQQVPHVPVHVVMIKSVLNVADVDREHNVVTVESTHRYAWHCGVTWNASDFDGVDVISLPSRYLWTPVIQPINAASELVDMAFPLVAVFSNGSAAMACIHRNKILCDVYGIELGVTCRSRWSVWGYSKEQVALAKVLPEAAGLARYFEGSRYELKNMSFDLIDFQFDTKIYQILDFSMEIQEKPRRRQSYGPMRAFFQWN